MISDIMYFEGKEHNYERGYNIFGKSNSRLYPIFMKNLILMVYHLKKNWSNKKKSKIIDVLNRLNRMCIKFKII
jgi:hypothetical protein